MFTVEIVDNYMFRFLYSLIISTVIFFIRIWPFKSLKLKQGLQGRKTTYKSLKQADLKGCIWFHVASLGEFEQAQPLITLIRKHHPSEKILLTFFSPSGYEIEKDNPLVDHVDYLPFDTSWQVSRFIESVEPKVFLLAKYELWYNLLAVLVKKQIPSFLFSMVFYKNHFIAKWYGKPYRKLLRQFTRIFVQDMKSFERLKELHFLNVDIAGDSRIDRVIQERHNISSLPLIERFKEDQKVFIGGSTWPPDLELLQELHTSVLKPNRIKLIIAPHDVSKYSIDIVKSKFPGSLLYSTVVEDIEDSADVLIIDRIGILKSLYRYSNYAYIGGGFGKGIHNILEPAAFGLPVFFGPNYRKFNEAVDLAESGGAYCVNNINELKVRMTELLSPGVYAEVSKKVTNYIQAQRGATEIIYRQLKPFI